MYTCPVHDNDVDQVIKWIVISAEERREKERVGEREKKGKEGEKWFEGKERLFAFV